MTTRCADIRIEEPNVADPTVPSAGILSLREVIGLAPGLVVRSILHAFAVPLCPHHVAPTTSHSSSADDPRIPSPHCPGVPPPPPPQPPQDTVFFALHSARVVYDPTG